MGKESPEVGRTCRALGYLISAQLIALLVAQVAMAAPEEGYLRVKGPSVVRQGLPRVVARIGGRPEFFSARLNGRDITRSLLRLDGRPRRATLSPTDGLHRGRNRLVVVAGRRGRRDRDRVRLVVRSRVLPAAGRDRRIRPGRRFRLNGSRSLTDGRNLDYRWKIVRRPRGSHARLLRRRSPRPRLLTDVRGIYRVTLALVGRGRHAGRRSAARSKRIPRIAAKDHIEVSATQARPIGLRLETLKQQEGVYGVTVAGRFYPSPDSTNNSVQLLQFHQQTMEPRSNSALPLGAGPKVIAEAVCGLTGVVIVQVPPALIEPFELQVLPEIRCPPKSETPLGPGWSLVRAGDATINTRGAIEGYLQKNAVTSNAPKNETPVITEWFRFVAGDYLSYTTEAPDPPVNGNTIRIGGPMQSEGLSDTQQLPAGASGFHVVAFDAQTLAPLSSRAFATNLSANEAGAIAEMAAWLEGYETNPGARVIVQSIGAPNANLNPDSEAWAKAAEAIAALGGNSHVFNTINGSYALFGGAGMGARSISDSAELSSALTGRPARLQGVLARDPLYRFAPRLTDPAGRMDLSLMPIAFQEETPWPHPDDTAGEQAAAKWLLANRLSRTGLGSVEALREKYWSDSTFIRDISDYIGELQCSSVPSDEEFSAEDFKEVCAELEAEFEWVSIVAALFGTPGNVVLGELQQPLIAPETTEIANDIKEGLARQLSSYQPGSSSVVADPLSFASDLAWVGEELVPIEPINPIGIVAAALGIASEIGSTSNGEAADDALYERADQLATEFLDSTATTVLQLNKLTEIIVSDYGKLSRVGALAGPSGSWQWDEEDHTNAANSFTAGAARWAYRELLPVRYTAQILVASDEAENESNTAPGEYNCIDVEHDPPIVPAFDNPPEQSYFDHYAAPEEPDAYWIMLDGDGNPPSSALAGALQSKPIELHLPWLFEELPLKSYDVHNCK